MEKIKFKGNEINYIEINANNDLGFNFPFGIIIPQNINDNPNIIYASNLTPYICDECSKMDDLINLTKNGKNRFDSIDPMMTHLCLDLGNPLVIPFIPRLRYFRPNFLGRDCLLNNFKLSDEDKKYEQYMFMYNNLADQHKSMMEHAIEILRSKKIFVSNKVIISGYSEGAKFASHLALLHPEMINAVIAGGTGGVLSMPVSEINGYEFIYPTGISDLKNFDFDSFKNISFFNYMGDNDKTDSAIPNFEDYHYIDENGNDQILRDECGNQTPYVDEKGNSNFILDKNGNYTAKFNLFSDFEVNAINKVLGTKIQDRFKKQQEIFENLGLKSISNLYHGNHRSIFDETDLIFSDVDSFINKYVKNSVKIK